MHPQKFVHAKNLILGHPRKYFYAKSKNNSPAKIYLCVVEICGISYDHELFSVLSGSLYSDFPQVVLHLY